MINLDNADANGIIKVPMNEIIVNYYMDYAKSTIVERSFPFIDGFKPVTRRIMFTMNSLKAYIRKSRKCARIVGDTMGRFHPHGDGSIYGALVNMVDVHETLNAPLIRGQGSFGKSWSTEHFVPAAMRYTEAALTELAEKELFVGLSENAVDMLDNFSVDEKEPRLLPVSFPNIIINNTNGIAVGMSTYIPTYTLKGACEAVKSIIYNKNISSEELANVLGDPDFCTGGNIHISQHQRVNLVENGAAKGIYLTGSYSLNKNQITIYELPYNTNVEKFIGELKDMYKAGLLRGVKSIDNTSGRSSKGSKKDNSKCKLKVEIVLTRGADPEEIMKKIRQNTSFSNPISFFTKFVWWNTETQDYEYKETGILELLRDYWIPWRVETLKRINTFRMEKLKADRHLLSAWQILLPRLDEIVEYIKKHTKAQGKEYLMTTFKLDAEQADYVIGKRLYHLSVDEIQKSIDEIKVLDAKIYELFQLVTSRNKLEAIIVNDMDRIISKYATDRKCNTFDLSLIEADKEDKVKKEEIVNFSTWVGVTKSGGLKRVINPNDVEKIKDWARESNYMCTIPCMNLDTILVFTSAGFCYKVPVHTIETSRGEFRDSIWKLNQRADGDNGEIIKVLATHDYRGTMTVLYTDGTGLVVPFNTVSGPRLRYRSIYPAFENGKTGMIYDHNKFFVITKDKYAAHVDLEASKGYAEQHGKLKVKLPRWRANDSLAGFMPDEDIKLLSVVDIERFNRPYCVKMREDGDYILNIVTEIFDPEMEEQRQIYEEMVEKEKGLEHDEESNAEDSGAVDESEFPLED